MFTCTFLTLLSYGALLSGGILLAPLTGSLLIKGSTFGANVAPAGLLLAAVGAGTLHVALRRAQSSAGFVPFDGRRTLLFGLLFPGAAQVYAGRWGRGALFFFGPLAAFALICSIIIVASLAAPQLLQTAVVSRALMLTIPVSGAALWLASLFEARRWASRQPANVDTSGWPRAKGVTAAFGAILFLLPFTAAFYFVGLAVMLRARMFFL